MDSSMIGDLNSQTVPLGHVYLLYETGLPSECSNIGMIEKVHHCRDRRGTTPSGRDPVQSVQIPCNPFGKYLETPLQSSHIVICEG